MQNIHTYILLGFTILEAVVIGINKWFPDLTTVVLQSDNASCYQSAALLIMIQYLIYPHSIRVWQFMHAEIQVGKYAPDAHFAQSTQVVYDYWKAGIYTKKIIELID